MASNDMLLLNIRSVLGTEKYPMEYQAFKSKFQELTGENLPANLRTVDDIANVYPSVIRTGQ